MIAMRPTPLNREDIRKVLGDVDDIVVSGLIGAGVTADELTEAQAWVTSDESLLNAGQSLPKGRVSMIAEILESIEDERSPIAEEP